MRMIMPFRVLVGVFMDGLVIAMDVGMRVGMGMLMGVNHAVMAVGVGMDMAVKMRVLQGNGIYDH